MKQKIYVFFALLAAVISIAWHFIDEIERRYTERVFLKLQEGLEVALKFRAGSYSMAVVEASSNWKDYSSALNVEGLWCRVEQESRVCYEGYVTGIVHFSADAGRNHPIIIHVNIRENADLFSKCYLVMGQPP